MFLLLWGLPLRWMVLLVNLSSECLLQHVAGLVLPFRCLPFIAQPSLCFLFLRPLPDTIISLMLAFCLLAHPRTLGGSLGFASPVPDGSVGRVFSLLLWAFGCRLNGFSMFLLSACLLTTWLIWCTSSRAPRLPPVFSSSPCQSVELRELSHWGPFFLAHSSLLWYCDPCFIVFFFPFLDACWQFLLPRILITLLFHTHDQKAVPVDLMILLGM